MEYGQIISELPVCLTKCNTNYLKHPGWKYSTNCNLEEMFAPENINNLSKIITSELEGVDPNGRNIVVPNKTICNVLSSIYQNFVPPTGDIVTRYIIPNINNTFQTQT